MSTFYGMIRGNSGEATRCGSKASGFKATAQSYDGSVIVNMRYNKGGELEIGLGTNDGSGSYSDYNCWDFVGSLEELKNLLLLNKQLKDGEVEIIKK